MNQPAQEDIKSGLLIFHSNRSEHLVEVVGHWMRRQPLGALEEEIILTQSIGMAEWVKMELARISGVCAVTRVELPARFLWRTYRQVLGREAVPSDSPLDKVPMTWRLMQLLPTLLEEPDFAPVAGFLKADEPDRLWQLASKLADLFDQYQNYRADWLEAWAQGHDHLILANGTSTELASDQRWQAQLWRAVLETLSESQRQSIRPRLHQRVLARLATSDPTAHKIARRVIVFGMSQIPWATLQALAALSQHSQVILAVPNPCQYHWGDIMDGRELLRSLRRRQPHRDNLDLSGVALEDMHAHANPLLAAWGRQGRDFIRQLDVFDDVQLSQQRFNTRVDFFDLAEEDAKTTLLKQVQNRIRDLQPLPAPEHKPTLPSPKDKSIVFHSAHSHVRELEILQDQLLGLFATQTPDCPLNPRDVIVMVPDIEKMAPAIRAVFGQYQRQDARYIPFDIADMSAKSNNPCLGAVDWLLRLPHQRCRMTDLVDLLEVPAVASRFGIEQSSLPKLTQWMVGAGIRWGLNSEHRTDLGLDACGDQNSAWFGVRRMMLGYACGAQAWDESLVDTLFSCVEPYAEVGGLEAELAGSLAHLLDTLVKWWELARSTATPQVWTERFRILLAGMIQAESDRDQQILHALEDGVATWLSACEQAGFDASIDLTVARSGWLEAINEPRLKQRFKAGGLTFCTLMPMRAIPFEVICLLGMNDGDYPRRARRSDFDLMDLIGTSRPGDRSRRDDDRQLMLEALLSARQLLYISWCGHSVRDNTEQPPSVLVSQLRDYLSAGWGSEVVSQRTTEHPLQPFSRRYFEAKTSLLTYAREWRLAHATKAAVTAELGDLNSEAFGPEDMPDQQGAHSLAPFEPDPHVPLTLAQLTQFLRNPVKAFFRQRLLVSFEEEKNDNFDDECFTINGFDEYQLIQDLLSKATGAGQVDEGIPLVKRALNRLRKAGELPMGGLGTIKQQALEGTVTAMLQAWYTELARFPDTAQRQSVRLQVGEVVLEDWIDQLRQGQKFLSQECAEQSGTHTAWLELQPGKLLAPKKTAARPEKLLAAWVRSLAVAASGLEAHGVLVGRDGVVNIAPVPKDEAQSMLGQLLAIWLEGMNTPLPLPPKTALAWLTSQESALSQYEGGYTNVGEVQEPCLERSFPDFEALTRGGHFDALAKQVYGPLTAWVSQYVTARFHVAEQTVMEVVE